MDDYKTLISRVVKRIDTVDDTVTEVNNAITGADKQKIASVIDHTLLKPDAAEKDIAALCEEGDKYGFAAVCVNSGWVEFCGLQLKNPGVRVCGVAGFPLGANGAVIKAAEAAFCLEKGAAEVDMVMNIGRAKAGDWRYVEEDIAAVVKAVEKSALVKVIIECCLLTDEEKVKACLCAVNAGADFVKTSTGFSKGGAKPSDVALMRRVVGENVGVKAAGGIRNLVTVKLMLEAGANRIGTSSGTAIIEEL